MKKPADVLFEPREPGCYWIKSKKCGWMMAERTRAEELPWFVMGSDETYSWEALKAIACVGPIQEPKYE